MAIFQSDIIIPDGEVFQVEAGDSVNNAIVNSGGSMLVHSDGTATNTTVNFGGMVDVYYGGVAKDILENGGYVYVDEDCTDVSFQPNTINDLLLDNVSATVHSGTTANVVTVNPGGRLAVFSGGTATEVRENGGYVYVDEDCTDVSFQPNTINDLLLDNVSATVHSGTTATRTTVVSGRLHIFSGGMADSTTVSSGGALCVSSGGIADLTELKNKGQIEVRSGGMAKNTTVPNGGSFYVFPGGTADSTTVSNGGRFVVSSGVTADHTEIKRAGEVEVRSGGTAGSTTVSSGGSFTVSSGGTAKITTVSSGGTATGITLDFGQILTVESGSFVDKITVNSGGIANGMTVDKSIKNTFNPGAILNSTTVNYSAMLCISSGGMADNTTVISGGTFFVSSGGTADNTTVSSGGTFCVFSGGTADDVVVSKGANLYVSSGGTATNIDWNPWLGTMSLDDGAYTTFKHLYSGVYFSGNQWSERVGYDIAAHAFEPVNVMANGVASRVVVAGQNSRYTGSCGIWNGGMLFRTSVFQNGILDVFSGGTAAITYVGFYGPDTLMQDELGGRMFVHRGGQAISTTVTESGSIFISSGGLAINTTVGNGGHLIISSGGMAAGIIENGGYVEVADGADVSFRSNVIRNGTFSNFQYATIHSGTTASQIKVSSASLSIFDGGLVNSATIGDIGQVLVSGGTANDVDLLGTKRPMASIVQYAPSCVIFSGGTANRTNVGVGGFMLSGGIANNTTVDEYGEFYVFDGGTANDTILLDGIPAFGTRGGLRMMVYDGIANNTVVGSGGVMHVCSTAVASGITIHSGGSLTTCSGGKLTGYLTFEKGATVSADDVTIVFDLTGATAGHSAFISDLSLVNGNPVYAMTVSDNQKEGVYALADGAGDFGGTITVTNSFGSELGVLSVGNAVVISGVLYTLFLAGEELSLAVGCDPSSGPDIVSYGDVLTNETETVNSGEAFVRTTVRKGGVLDVLDGGAANGVVVSSGGSVTVEGSGAANDVVISGGSVTVEGSGAANGVVVSGGCMVVSDGAAANDVKVSSDGSVKVESGGTVNDAAIYSCGSVFISSGAAVSGAFVGKSGYLAVSKGGMITGEIRLAGNVNVSAGGIVCFDLTRTSSSADEPLINDLLLVRGSPDYQLAVSDTTQGFFKLAGVSASFSSNITVVDSAGNSMGRTSQKTINDVIFSTFVSHGVLVANIGSGAIVLSMEDRQRVVQAGEVYSGTMVRSGGSLIVSNGGFATDIVENGGFVKCSADANVTFASNTFSGLILSGGLSATVHSGTTAVFTTLEDRVYFDVFSGGLAVNTIISRGNLKVSSGGVASGATMLGGKLSVKNGGVATDITVNRYVDIEGLASGFGTLSIEQGGVASRVTVNNGGRLSATNGDAIDVTVGFGGSAYGISLKDGNKLTVSSGGIANSINVSSGGTLFTDGGQVRATVRSGGLVTGSFFNSIGVQSGGLASNVTIGSNGTLSVQMGGTATSTTVCSGGSLFLEYECSADFTTLNSGGRIRFYSVLNHTTINSGGSLLVERGCVAGNTVLNSGGTLTVMNGGTATLAISDPWNVGMVVSSRGATVLRQYDAKVYYRDMVAGEIISKTDMLDSMCICSRMAALVCSGGTANSIIVSEGGVLAINSGGTANDAEVRSLGDFIIDGGGTANNTTVYGGGIASIVYGGAANGAVVRGGGSFNVYSGGTASDMTVLNGGRLLVSSSGKLTGRMSFESEAVVSMYVGAVLDFDLTQMDAGSVALVNDLSILRGAPQYRITVDAERKGSYVYALADGAASFGGTFTVQDTLGRSIGSLRVGKTLEIGYDSYTLNLVDSTLTVTIEVPDLTPSNPVGTADRVSWEASGANQYIVEYSTDNFEHATRVVTTGNSIDMPELPAGTYQWRVKADANSDWVVGAEIVSDADSGSPKVVQAVEDGNDDLFFATPNGMWNKFYYAKHVGSINDWSGTDETVSAGGKGRIRDLFFGAADPNVLCLTDEENGDAIFVDDAFTGLPEEIEENTSRLYKIHEIRAGVGDDIVDMTSQRCEYTGDGLTIRGGDGDDVIWTNKGDNMLFGDAGNDRIVGASGNDVVAGGIGNDRLHGAGGDDVFTFCNNWGEDIVEQLETGSVTLWFASGSEENWNPETLTYSSGTNSVTVTGVAAEQVTLKFGGENEEDAAQFAALSEAGAFASFTSRRIFEESGKGLLA